MARHHIIDYAALLRNKPFFEFQKSILFEDNDLLVINKPAGISTLNERNLVVPSILGLVRKHIPDAQVCHRLDKMTSGVLILAKNQAAMRGVALQFQKRGVSKFYHTLVSGVQPLVQHEIKLALSPLIDGKVVPDRLNGKKALTIVTALQVFNHFTLMECQPITGRSHQIRVHLAAIRCPIVGDWLYGGKNLMLSQIKSKYKTKVEQHELPINDTFVLHAHKTTFNHPSTLLPLTIVAPYPKNLITCLKILEKYDK